MTSKPLAFHNHNHQRCVTSAIAEAQTLCTTRGVRLTPLRLQVLELVWQSHKPLGAYALMDALSEQSTRRVAPPTVYRALDFLLEQGLIHRINGLNAFVGCPEPNHQHDNHFLICRRCGAAEELESDALNQLVLEKAQAAGFLVDGHSLEVNGVCPKCRSEQNDA